MLEYEEDRSIRTAPEGSRAMSKRILVIDDEEIILDTFKIIFEDMGYHVETFSDPVAGMAEAVKNEYDLIVTDIRMPGMDGAEVTEGIRKTKPNARILLVTAFPNDPIVPRALEAGAFALLKKPFEIAKILDFLQE
jgi:two-component system nitrogen regulation response regulator NtrX